MKLLELKFFIIFLLFSCNENRSFYKIKKEIYINKEKFNIGDSIIITMEMKSDNDNMIPIYENYKNIDFSFSIENEKRNIYNGYWSENRGKYLPETNINNIKISKDISFIKHFKGKIKEKNDSIHIVFSDYEIAFEKGVVMDSNSIIKIHGEYRSIHSITIDSDEDYFIGKEFRIR